MWPIYLVIGLGIAGAFIALLWGTAEIRPIGGPGVPTRTRAGWAAVASLTCVVVLLAAAQKLPYVATPAERWGTLTAFAYTDVPVLYGRFADGDVPYTEARIEYPVVSGLAMWLPALAADDERTYDALSFAILGWLALGVALLLYRAAGPRALLFVLTPVLLLDGFINWDLLAVLLATGSIVAFIRRRDGWAAALAGLGAAAKVYPFLLLPLYAADRTREAGRRAGLRVLGIGLATWVAVNLPVALASFHGWWVFYAFSGDRQPLGASTWGVLCRRVLSCDSIPPIDAASLVAFVGLSAWAWWVKVRRDPEVPRWTLIFPIVVAFLLTNKIYSPQYSLWLLPLFALVLPDVRLVVAFVSADLAVFVAELSTNFPDLLPAPLPFWVLDVAAFVRAFVLIVCVARYLRTPWIEIAGAPDSRGVEGTLVDAT